MENINYFKDLFESIPDYRKIALLIYIIQNDKNLLHEIGFSERDIHRLILECKNMLKEEFEENYSFFKNEKESILERFLNK